METALRYARIRMNYNFSPPTSKGDWGDYGGEVQNSHWKAGYSGPPCGPCAIPELWRHFMGGDHLRECVNLVRNGFSGATMGRYIEPPGGPQRWAGAAVPAAGGPLSGSGPDEMAPSNDVFNRLLMHTLAQT